MVWYGLVWSIWYGLVWDNLHLNALWKFHEDLTCFGCFREDLKLVWFGLIWYGLVWYGLLWFETTSIWRFCESFIKIRLVLAVLDDLQLVWYGMVWFGLVWDNIQLKLLWNFHQDPTSVTLSKSYKTSYKKCDVQTSERTNEHTDIHNYRVRLHIFL